MQPSELNPRTLAIGCACYIKGWAVLNFPQSTRAHPSYWVMVSRSTSTPRNLPIGDSFGFPLGVAWDVWQGVVVPTLTGLRENVMLPFGSLVNVLEASLRSRMQQVGLIL